MNLMQFTRKRALIERDFPKGAKRAAAMRGLVREAGAAVVIMEGHVAGWRLKSGEMVCVKMRHKDQARALAELDRARSTNWNGHRVPTRAYACIHCKGWHVTSQAALFEQAA